jgi:hypothetical protein
MTLRRYSKKHIQQLITQVHDLKTTVRSLEQQQEILLLQDHTLTDSCDLLHLLRTGSVHQGWVSYSNTFLPGELPLLADLGWSADRDSNKADGLNVASTCLLAERQQQKLQQALQRRQQLASRSQTPQQEPMCCEEELVDEEQHLSSGTAGSESPLSTSVSEELPFVRPLGGISASAAAADTGCAAADGVSASGATRVFLTPAGPLGVFKWTLQQQPYPDADRWTLPELVQIYSNTVKNMAFHLTLLSQQQERGDISSSTQHMLALKSLVTQNARRIAAVLLLHPEDLLNTFRMVNCETMELSENPEEVCFPPGCSLARACWGVGGGMEAACVNVRREACGDAKQR